MNALNTVEYMHNLGVQAKAASALMASASAATKNKALKALARLLREHVSFYDKDRFFAPDIEAASQLLAAGHLTSLLPAALLPSQA